MGRKGVCFCKGMKTKWGRMHRVSFVDHDCCRTWEGERGERSLLWLSGRIVRLGRELVKRLSETGRGMDGIAATRLLLVVSRRGRLLLC